MNDKNVQQFAKSPFSGSEELLNEAMTEISSDQSVKQPINLTQNPQQDQLKNNLKTNQSDNVNQSILQNNQSNNLQDGNEDFKEMSISDILLKKGYIDEKLYNEIKFEIANGNKDEESIIISKGGVEEKKVVEAKALSFGKEFVDILAQDISRDVILKIPFESAKAHRAVAFKDEPLILHVAMADPLDIQRVNFIEAQVKKTVKTYFAVPEDIDSVIDTRYAGKIESAVSEAVQEAHEGIVEIDESVQDINQLGPEITNAPVARIVNMILEYAVKFNASDIHIEPRENRMSVRFRINGIMNEKLNLPRSMTAPLVARIKILADLKIDEKRIPQDGRFGIKVKDTEVDLRISTIPTVFGEKVVIRLLKKSGGLMNIEDTGLRGYSLKLFREALNATQGIILVTGPTGSGKTQTLASSLKILNRPQVNIITLEDPVEIKIDGVNQVQINPDIGLTFAKGLRAILRQDPDIIMVGEIRDEETASLSVQAALVGRLVLSTLHTNSAAGALPRLLDMHIEPYLLASTINIIVAQRLVRKICDSCKEEFIANDEIVKLIHKVMNGLRGFDMFSYPKRDNKFIPPGAINTADLREEIPPSEMERMIKAGKFEEKVKLFKGKGCNKCNNTGYSGRTGIFEVLKLSEKISQMIMEHRSASTIEAQAREEGMITMMQDGFMKALEGITTIEEVLRVQSR